MVRRKKLDVVRDRLPGLLLIDVQGAGGDPVPQDVDQFRTGAPAGLPAAHDDDPFIVAEIVRPARHRQGVRGFIQAHMPFHGRFGQHAVQEMIEDGSGICLYQWTAPRTVWTFR